MRRCLISAGPTREYLDPVRFLSNPSSGKMGYALAEAARELGWETTLVSGPVALDAPVGVERIMVETAAEMEAELGKRFSESDLLIMAAAVGDFRPEKVADRKIKREGNLTLTLVPVADILASLSAKRRPGQVLVGFAAETNHLEDYARGKLEKKGIDWIVGNRVDLPGGGFGSDDNTVVVYSREGADHSFGPLPKRELARKLMQLWTPET